MTPDTAVVNRRDPDAVERLLRALPDWFGIEEAIRGYTADAADDRFVSLLALREARVVGVALVRRHFPESAELHLIAVSPEAHRTGLGRRLVGRVAADLVADGCRVLSVHTVGPSFDDPGYARTRAFYLATGFIPLEEHDGLDWAGPTLILVKPLTGRCGPPVSVEGSPPG